jgi:hypothetical protein
MAIACAENCNSENSISAALSATTLARGHGMAVRPVQSLNLNSNPVFRFNSMENSQSLTIVKEMELAPS